MSTIFDGALILGLAKAGPETELRQCLHRERSRPDTISVLAD